MEPLNIMVANFNFLQQWTGNQSLIRTGLGMTLSENSWLSEVLQWLSHPDVLVMITVWWITFTVIMTMILSIGFGPLGVITGSLAAAFQSFMYGGLTPASGIFATLTSMAMLGILMPVASIGASIIATGVTVMVWKYKYGVQ